jgi:hypothetical protein
MPKPPKSEDERREDDVLRRMLKTPPKRHAPLKAEAKRKPSRPKKTKAGKKA